MSAISDVWGGVEAQKARFESYYAKQDAMRGHYSCSGDFIPDQPPMPAPAPTNFAPAPTNFAPTNFAPAPTNFAPATAPAPIIIQNPREPQVIFVDRQECNRCCQSNFGNIQWWHLLIGIVAIALLAALFVRLFTPQRSFYRQIGYK